MNIDKLNYLIKLGWAVGTVQELLGLTDEELETIEQLETSHCDDGDKQYDFYVNAIDIVVLLGGSFLKTFTLILGEYHEFQSFLPQTKDQVTC